MYTNMVYSWAAKSCTVYGGVYIHFSRVYKQQANLHYRFEKGMIGYMSLTYTLCSEKLWVMTSWLFSFSLITPTLSTESVWQAMQLETLGSDPLTLRACMTIIHVHPA